VKSVLQSCYIFLLRNCLLNKVARISVDYSTHFNPLNYLFVNNQSMDTITMVRYKIAYYFYIQGLNA